MRGSDYRDLISPDAFLDRESQLLIFQRIRNADGTAKVFRNKDRESLTCSRR